MRLYRPKPVLLILEHGPLRNVVIVFAVIAVAVPLAFRWGAETGLVVSLLGFGYAWAATRRFEHKRVLFDRSAGSVDIRRRSVRHGSGTARYGLDEIGAVELEDRGFEDNRFYRLFLVIPEGPHAGRHPLNLFEVDDRRIPEHARTINHWLEKRS